MSQEITPTSPNTSQSSPRHSRSASRTKVTRPLQELKDLSSNSSDYDSSVLGNGGSDGLCTPGQRHPPSIKSNKTGASSQTVIMHQKDHHSYEIINNEILDYRNICRTGRPSWCFRRKEAWNGNFEDEMDFVHQLEQHRRGVFDLSSSGRVLGDDVVHFVAIQLLGSCFTLSPEQLSLGGSIYHSSNTSDWRFPGPGFMSTLRMHTIHRYSPAFGHHARDSSPESPSYYHINSSPSPDGASEHQTASRAHQDFLVSHGVGGFPGRKGRKASQLSYSDIEEEAKSIENVEATERGRSHNESRQTPKGGLLGRWQRARQRLKPRRYLTPKQSQAERQQILAAPPEQLAPDNIASTGHDTIICDSDGDHDLPESLVERPVYSQSSVAGVVEQITLSPLPLATAVAQAKLFISPKPLEHLPLRLSPAPCPPNSLDSSSATLQLPTVPRRTPSSTAEREIFACSPQRPSRRESRRSNASDIYTPDDEMKSVRAHRNALSVVGSALATPEEDQNFAYGSDGRHSGILGASPIPITTTQARRLMLHRPNAIHFAHSYPQTLPNIPKPSMSIERAITLSGTTRWSSSGTQIVRPGHDSVDIDGFPTGPPISLWERRRVSSCFTQKEHESA